MQKILIFFSFILFLETYVYFGFNSSLSGVSVQVFRVVYWVSLATTLVTIFLMFYYFPVLKGKSNWFTANITGLMMGFIGAKIVLVLVFLGEDLFRGGKYLFDVVLHRVIKGEESPVSLDSRRKFITQIGIGLAAVPFLSLIYGVIKGRYDFKVHKIVLKSKDIPKAFDGFKIAQFSDLHSGSFEDQSGLLKGVELLQNQQPDMILFTGDLVNNHAHEIEPYISIFNDLKASYGKFSVMGNHDYGKYVLWNSEAEEQNNVKKIRSHHKSMGFDLLENENRLIEKGGDSIRLVGVENWGNPPFPQYGDLDKAIENTKASEFTILMSHDPDHWEEKTLKNDKMIHLTLAGHTHGSQFGIEIPGFKWSPVQYKYKRWAGLYEKMDRFLYVNRGFGFLGYPGRVGIWPEITIIELKATS
jgi:predicted MPP superfamily phosphohydrolase